jgi:hypothetical protein
MRGATVSAILASCVLVTFFGCVGTNAPGETAGDAGTAAAGTGRPVSEHRAAMPRLEQRDGMTKLIVDGRPFICVAGELRNSTSSDVEAAKAAFARLAQANLNTILTVVSWDLIEPEEGRFDFSLIDYQLEAARANNLRLIPLWMGSWKNGLSHYVPTWVKADEKRFPRVVNADGNHLEILSTLSDAAREADTRAFAALMRHLREVDRDHTVIAVQVQNEVGVQGSTRDFGAAANAAFASPVPGQLTAYLQQHRDALLPEFKKVWMDAGGKTAGTWEEVFGRNVQRTEPPVPNSPTRSLRPEGQDLSNHADEIFQAWHYARYIGRIAEAGKREYPLPMFVNAWLVQANDRGPGDYPSGGPEPFVHDVWRAGAPAIDILAPDIYQPQFAEIVRTFARNGNPAWVPETRQNAAMAWEAFTALNVLCYSPFGIDSLAPDSAFARAYGLINGLSGALAEAQGKEGAIQLLTLQPGANPGRVEKGNYVFDFTPPPGRRGGRGGAATAPATQPPPAQTEPAGRGGFGSGLGGGGGLPFMDGPFLIIVQTGPREFYFATNGNYPCRISSKKPGVIATAATIDRGAFKNGRWVTTRRLNGDDIMGLGYDVTGAAARGMSGTQVPLGGRGGPGFGRGAAAPAQSPEPTITRVVIYEYAQRG